MNPIEIAKLIDHTLLKADANHHQLSKLCNEAIQFQFASVCVNPWNVSFCANILKDSQIPEMSNIQDVDPPEGARNRPSMCGC